MVESLSNAKAFTLAFRMYAEDNGGKFPSTQTDGKPLRPGDASNRAFEHLIPKYSSSKAIFINKASAWCRPPATDTGAADANKLKKGQNDWNYFVGLSSSRLPDDRLGPSEPPWPLIATATASATDLTYTKDVNARGGVWGGTDAIVGYTDGSARQIYGADMNLTDPTRTFPKRPDTGASIFIATPEWLGPRCFILAPE